MLTTSEAAAKLDITPSLVRRYIRRGRLRAVKVGRDHLITPTDLRKFTKLPRKQGRKIICDTP